MDVQDHGRDQRRRHDAAYRRAGVDDAHGRGVLLDRKPFRDRPRGRRKTAALASAQQQPAQNAPCSIPIPKAPRQPSRQRVMINSSGARHLLKQLFFSGVN